MEHCDTNELMPDYQSAYRTHYSCETALVKLMDDLLWAMEGQSVTALMPIDLSAAFDTVDHEVLLSGLMPNLVWMETPCIGSAPIFNQENVK